MNNKVCAALGWLAVAGAMAIPVWAQPEARPDEVFPRPGSLKKSEVNVRSGPGTQYPILWVYQRANYPVQVLAKYDNYFKIRDAEGEEGWVYIGMLSRQATALVRGKTPAPLYRRPTPDSTLEARLAPGVVVVVEGCDAGLCQVEVPDQVQGWVPQTALLTMDGPTPDAAASAPAQAN